MSDWSADVCSSDLAVAPVESAPEDTTADTTAEPAPEDTTATTDTADTTATTAAADDTDAPAVAPGDEGTERKSVVSGKRVSVRVALGGLRIHNKNHPHTNPPTYKP